MKIRTIIFGASGMVGEGVLLQAIKDRDVESILVVGRKSCGIKNEKLKELIHNDFYNYSAIEKELSGYNACFFCLGVSSVGMSEKDYTKITYDLTIAAATALSKLNHDMTFCYISGEGTDSSEKGRLMWARVKGRTENQLKNLPFKAVYLFRPGFMKPVDGQKNLKSIYKLAGNIYPLMKTLFPNHGCKLEALGNAMINAVRSGYSKSVQENKYINLFARD
jgi:hypothetical protein